MAVENKYVSAKVTAGKLENPSFSGGAEYHEMVITFEVAAADDDGSVYRLATLPANAVLTKFAISNDAITAGTVYHSGLYRTVAQGGAVIDLDILGATHDMSAAATNASPKDGLKSVDIADLQKRIWEIAGDTLQTKRGSYDVALTGSTVGSAAGTITARIGYLVS